MNDFVILPHFARQLKKYTKKYRHLKDDVIFVLKQFKKSQNAALGHGLYKLRVRSRDIPKGKSSAFRLIVLTVEVKNVLVPVVVYFKGDRDDMSKKELRKHLNRILFELRVEGIAVD